MSLVTFETEDEAYRVFHRLVHYDNSWAIFGKTLQSPFPIHSDNRSSDSLFIAVLGGNINGVFDDVNSCPPRQQREFRKRMLNTILVVNESQECVHYKVNEIVFLVQHKMAKPNISKIPRIVKYRDPLDN
jgi:hypothetical protein